MGGFKALFSPPSPPKPEPAPPIEQVDPEEEARKKRLEIQARNRRGRAGLITTSPRGLAAINALGFPARKTLLGE